MEGQKIHWGDLHQKSYNKKHVTEEGCGVVYRYEVHCAVSDEWWMVSDDWLMMSDEWQVYTLWIMGYGRWTMGYDSEHYELWKKPNT